MLVKELVSRIKSLYSKGASSDDSRLSSRHVYSKIKSARAVLIKREQDKKRKNSPWNIQSIPCLRLEVVDASSCDCIIPAGCKLLKSVCKIPKPIQTMLATGIESVSTVDGSTLFSFTTWAKKRYKSGNKYTSQEPDYFVRDEFLYITHNTMLEWVAVSGIFEDPVDVYRFIQDPECACGEDVDPCASPTDSELELPEYLVEPLMQLAVQELVQMFGKMPEDNNNDAKGAEAPNE